MEKATEDIIKEKEIKLQEDEKFQESTEEERILKGVKRKNDQNYETDEQDNKCIKQQKPDSDDEFAVETELNILFEKISLTESLVVGETNEKNNINNESIKVNDDEEQTNDNIASSHPINSEEVLEETDLPSTSSSCEIDSSSDIDVLELEKKPVRELSLSILETFDENFFKKVVEMVSSQTGECTLSFDKATTNEENSFSLPLEEESDENAEDEEELEDSVLEMDSDEEAEGSIVLDYSVAESDEVREEVVKFQEISEKLDECFSLIPEDKNFDDKEIFISSIEELLEAKSINEEKSSTDSLSEVENSSYPELIDDVQRIFSASMKKYLESAFSFYKNYFPKEMTSETVTADNMNGFLEEVIKCCDDYFVLFLKSIMTDSYAYENLFQAVIKHLKSSLSFLNKFHPFLLLIIFSNYPKSNCIMLSKFLIVCKVIFSVMFDYSYALPYLQNLKRFLHFSMLEVYHNYDVNSIHYLFRKKAAKFYSYIVKEYFSQEQKNVISYLKKILLNEESKFCTCYGALCAIRAMGPKVETKVIPEIFPSIGLKLRSVKRFAEENSNLSYVKTLKDLKTFNSAEVNETAEEDSNLSFVKTLEDLKPFDSAEVIETELNSESEIFAMSPGDLMDEIQSEETAEFAAENESEASEEKFDTIIPSENTYASLIREELLNACSQLANKYVKNDRAFKKKSYLMSLTNDSVSSDAVEMFLDYFGQELSKLMPSKYFPKTVSKYCDTSLEEFLIK